MRIPDPLEITCPACDHHFERSLAWVRQEGQQCPECRGSLEAIRNKIDTWITSGIIFLEDIERIMAIEKEFKISIPDADAENLRTFAEAHDYLARRLVPDAGGRSNAEHIWGRLCSAIVTTPECRVGPNPSRDDPFIRTVLTEDNE